MKIEDIKTLEEVLILVEEIGTDFPKNVKMRLEFSNIESEEDIIKFAKQEKTRCNLFMKEPSIPYTWISWDVCLNLEVVIRSKTFDYVLG